jgi:hypothetical protein
MADLNEDIHIIFDVPQFIEKKTVGNKSYGESWEALVCI